MARGPSKRGGDGSGSAWRALSLPDRFSILANHFSDAQDFQRASGLPEKTVRRMYRLLRLDHQPSSYDWRELKSLFQNSDAVADGISKARKEMTHDLRQVESVAKKGQYVAPVGRSGTTKLEPFQYRIEGPAYNFVSKWVGYHVEYLPENEIFRQIEGFFNLFSDTGQYNVFRFEYIAHADIYLEEQNRPYRGAQTFKDKELHKQYLQSDIVKLSIHTLRIPDFNGDVNLFMQGVRDQWHKAKVKGGIRITDIYFANFDELREVMREIRSDRQAMRKRKGPKGGARGSRSMKRSNGNGSHKPKRNGKR